MLSVILALQVTVAQSGASQAASRLSARDSADLVKRVEETEFQFLMDWRYSWSVGSRLLFYERKAKPLPLPPNYDPSRELANPSGFGCLYEQTIRFDPDPRSWAAHLIKAARPHLSLCPIWARPNWYEPADERKSIDAGLTPMNFPPDGLDTARALRAPMIRVLDSASRLLPGDGWLSGQRVRLHLDQGDPGGAQRAAAECRAEPWWCAALQGYVQYSMGQVSRAATTFQTARTRMTDSLRCAWDDVGLFFTWTGRRAYEELTCAQRDPVNQRVWWLADPLYLENGNERHTEHYARQVLFALHAALDADERFDMRDNYQGPAVREMVLRFGWPTEIAQQPPDPNPCGTQEVLLPPDYLPRLNTPRCPRDFGTMRWRRGNTRSMFLGDSGVLSAAPLCAGPRLPSDFEIITAMGVREPPRVMQCSVSGEFQRHECPEGDGYPLNPAIDCRGGLVPPNIRYAGPQYHTVPLWETVLDPFHATDAGWDLAPRRENGPYWDTAWWPPEFYRRDNGPLVPLASQVAFFRRQRTAIATAAMTFDTIAYVSRPVEQVIGAMVITTGPDAPFAGGRDTMNGFRPRALVAAVPSGPALMGLEMIPRDGAGPAGRTRFGVDIPPPLGVLRTGELALSDLALTSVNPGEEAPATMVAFTPRMLGSTILRDPTRVGLFWELYGLATGDTIDVALRVIKKNSDGVLSRLGELFGFARATDDTVTMGWAEPRPDEPTATVEAGVTIRPRGMVLDLSAYKPGSYRLSLEVRRRRSPGVMAMAAREFTIERR